MRTTSDKPRWGAFNRKPGLQAVKVMKNKQRQKLSQARGAWGDRRTECKIVTGTAPGAERTSV